MPIYNSNLSSWGEGGSAVRLADRVLTTVAAQEGDPTQTMRHQIHVRRSALQPGWSSHFQ